MKEIKSHPLGGHMNSPPTEGIFRLRGTPMAGWVPNGSEMTGINQNG